MAHNTQEILSIIAVNPGIRQVEIADKVDCERGAA
ncbi:winged helix-turn-helix transcriptional regulator [Undibacterium sp. SXout11W]